MISCFAKMLSFWMFLLVMLVSSLELWALAISSRTFRRGSIPFEQKVSMSTELSRLSFEQKIHDIKQEGQKNGEKTPVVHIAYAISNSSEDKGLPEWLIQLSEDLKRAGITVTLDFLDCAVSQYKGEQYERYLKKSIKDADKVFVIVTPSYKHLAEKVGSRAYQEFQEASRYPHKCIPVIKVGSFEDANVGTLKNQLGIEVQNPKKYFRNLCMKVAELYNMQNEQSFEFSIEVDDRDVFTQVKKIEENIRKRREFLQARLRLARLHLPLNHRFELDFEQQEALRNLKVSRMKELSFDGTYLWESNLIKLPSNSGEERFLGKDVEKFLLNRNSQEKVMLIKTSEENQISKLFDGMERWLWGQSEKSGKIPLRIDLKDLDSSKLENILEEALRKNGLSESLVAKVKEDQQFVILIQGFEHSNIQTNLYVRNAWENLNVQVIFAVDKQFLEKNPAFELYFVPASAHNMSRPQGLAQVEILDQTGTFKFGEQGADPSGAPSEKKAPLKRPLLHRRVVTTNDNHELAEWLLRTRLLGPAFKNLVRNLEKVSSVSLKEPRTAFISYTWPKNYQKLQRRLRQLVVDLKEVNVNAILDVNDLKDNIQDFMNKIKSSDFVLWIGDPELPERLKDPNTNVFKEFEHIQSRVEDGSDFLKYLCFRKDDDRAVFPESVPYSPDSYFDFSDQDDYYRVLPRLIANILQVGDKEETQEYIDQYLDFLDAQEALITANAIGLLLSQQDRLEQNKRDRAAQQVLKLLEEAQLGEDLQGVQESTNSNVNIIRSASSVLNEESFVSRDLQSFVSPQGMHNSTDSSENCFDLEGYVNRFLRDDKRLLTLLGEGGAGKSMFLRYLEKQAWSNFDEQQRIPLYIHLPRISNPNQNLMENALGQLGFEKEDINLLKRQRKFLILLDGYDEVPLEKIGQNNIYTSNGLQNWDVKVILSSRTERLDQLEEQSRSLALESVPSEQVYIAPLNNEGVFKFFQNYSQLETSAWRPEEYMDYIKKVPGLQELAYRPFILKMIAVILPDLVNDKKTDRLSRSDIYKVFSDQWQYRAHWEVLSRGQRVEFHRNLQEDFQEFSENLAYEMYKSQKAWISQDDVISALSLSSSEFQLLNSGVPLRKNEQGEVRFIHKSLQEYFVACRMLKALRNGVKGEIRSYLEVRPLTFDPNIALFFASMLEDQDIERLIAVVKQSISDETHGQASANAMTVLNYANVLFTGQDFSNVRIPGADLRGAQLSGVNFENADLSGVNFAKANLRRANIKNAKMQGVKFGETAFLLSGNNEDISMVAYNHDETKIAVVKGSSVFVHDKKEPMLGWDQFEIDSSYTVVALDFDSEDNVVFGATVEEDELTEFYVQSLDAAGFIEKHLDLILVHGSPYFVSIDTLLKRVLIYECNREVRVWDWSGDLVGDYGAGAFAQLSPDKQNVIVCDDDGTVKLKSIEDPNSYTEFKVPRASNNAACSPNNHYIAYVSIDSIGSVFISDTKTQPYEAFKGQSQMSHLEFSVDGKTLVGEDVHGVLYVYDVENKFLIDRIEKSNAFASNPWGNINSLSKRFALGSKGEVLSGRSTSLNEWRPAKFFHNSLGHGCVVKSVVMSPDEQIIASGDTKGRILLWNKQRGRLLGEFREQDSPVQSMAFSPDGKILVIAYTNGALVALEWQDGNKGKVIFQQREASFGLNSVHFVSDKKLVATMTNKNKTKKYWACNIQPSLLTSIESVTNEDLFVIDALNDDRKFLKQYTAFKRSGGLSIYAEFSGLIKIWKNEQESNEDPFWTLKGHIGAVHSLSVSDDNKTIISAGRDGSVRIWNLQEDSSAYVSVLAVKPNLDLSELNGEVIEINAEGRDLLESYTLSPVTPKKQGRGVNSASVPRAARRGAAGRRSVPRAARRGAAGRRSVPQAARRGAHAGHGSVPQAARRGAHASHGSVPQAARRGRGSVPQAARRGAHAGHGSVSRAVGVGAAGRVLGDRPSRPGATVPSAHRPLGSTTRSRVTDDHASNSSDVFIREHLKMFDSFAKFSTNEHNQSLSLLSDDVQNEEGNYTLQQLIAEVTENIRESEFNSEEVDWIAKELKANEDKAAKKFKNYVTLYDNSVIVSPGIKDPRIIKFEIAYHILRRVRKEQERERTLTSEQWLNIRYQALIAAVRIFSLRGDFEETLNAYGKLLSSRKPVSVFGEHVAYRKFLNKLGQQCQDNQSFSFNWRSHVSFKDLERKSVDETIATFVKTMTHA